MSNRKELLDSISNAGVDLFSYCIMELRIAIREQCTGPNSLVIDNISEWEYVDAAYTRDYLIGAGFDVIYDEDAGTMTISWEITE